jgi:hypothetical protein
MKKIEQWLQTEDKRAKESNQRMQKIQRYQEHIDASRTLTTRKLRLSELFKS